MFNFDNPHYYDILEVGKHASQEEIIASFRRLAKEYHPDGDHFQFSSQKHEAQEKFKLINEAYHILKDPIKRAEYDTFLNYIIWEQVVDAAADTEEEYRDEGDPNYIPASKKFYFIGLPLFILPIILGVFSVFVKVGVLPIEQSSKLDYQLSPKEVFNKNNESVVLIKGYDENGNVVSFGSGVCVHSDGVIITNLHVLNSDNTFFDIEFPKHGAYADVYVAGISPILEDYLVLRVDGKDLPSVNISNRTKYDIGEGVVTIGNPEGLLNSLSEGVVSGRRFDADYEYYQMTAPISQGSSGGAVFDENGYLIGVSTAILEEGQNLNFFLPIYRINNNTETFDTALTIEQFNSLRKSRAEEHKKAGNQYLLSKDYKQAKNNYEISLKYYDNDADTYYANSKAEYQLGLDDEALSSISAAILYYLNDEKGKLLNVKRRAEEIFLPAEVAGMFDIGNMEKILKDYYKGDNPKNPLTSKNNLNNNLQLFKEKSTVDTTPLATEELKKETELKKSDVKEVIDRIIHLQIKK